MTSARDLAWTLGAPVRLLLLGGVRLYRLTLSGWLGGQCRFHPTCSRYAEGAIRTHGAVNGTLLATRRILRCNPFGRGGLDPVPPRDDGASQRTIASYIEQSRRPCPWETTVLAEIAPFQWLLDGIGWVLAWLYDLVGNFGIAIILLTIVFRIVLLPLGIKQIKSMQAMQALQPKIKEIQKKFKGNKQKIQEQTMKLYQEYGVNPLGGCLPLLLQFPILIAMYSVIRAPVPYAETDPSKPPGVECPRDAATLPPACFKDNHLPPDSELFVDMTEQNEEGMTFLLMNLQCSPQNAGKTVPVPNTERRPSGHTLDCGDSWPDRIPYYMMLALMIGTTFYSTRQTQKATPASAQNPQTQIISKVMPVMFGIFGFAFPAGLVLYWTVSNAFQIGQQGIMLRLGHIGPEAMDRRLSETKAKAATKSDKPRSGLMGSIMERADQERKKRQPDTPAVRKPPPRSSGKGGAKGTGGGSPKSSSGGQGSNRKRKGGSGRPKGSGPNRPKPPRR